MNRARATRLTESKRNHFEQLLAVRNHARLLKFVLEGLFPDAQARRRAKQLLAGYSSPAADLDRDRVLLSILQLSGGDLAETERTVLGATEDPEDIVNWAETPIQMKLFNGFSGMTTSEVQRVRDDDRQEYDDWLRGAAAGKAGPKRFERTAGKRGRSTAACRNEMTSEDVAAMVARELEGGDFDNWHGITKANIAKHLVTPVLDQHEDEAPSARMREFWTILREDAVPLRESRGSMIDHGSSHGRGRELKCQ